ncbi:MULTISPECIES: SIS domain-containing protein [unclassified Clostridium]|uniref:D-sedoheptulose-7-phosphate isomerase n=1 Tax=unclassified Clostridium TaxID=2614128 RepID=UPI0002976CB3|nr:MULTISPECIES: SIS domain-containing protein [unclassified Clostridium]EKQ56970.1 MAG: phosphoheptose isomerase [Clostridium sp. Maddingley MBC34-26]
MEKLIKERINESIIAKQAIVSNSDMLDKIGKISKKIAKTISNGGKLLICGNGGSASDSLHFAGEIVGRFQQERRAWPAIVLNADVATMTAIANDYGYEEVFSRQTEGLMTNKDILIGFSTSGNSKNVCQAMLKAKEIGGFTVGMLGGTGGEICKLADYSIVVPSKVTARIQESHIMIVHIICEIVEKILIDNKVEEN